MALITNARIAAAKRFNPKNLCGYLTKGEDGVAVVDRAKLLQTKDDERLFVIAMNADYRLNYSDCDCSTVYFEVEDERIIGGIYNLQTRTKKTKRQIAISPEGVGVTRQYVYSQSTLDEMRKAILNA